MAMAQREKPGSEEATGQALGNVVPVRTVPKALENELAQYLRANPSDTFIRGNAEKGYTIKYGGRTIEISATDMQSILGSTTLEGFDSMARQDKIRTFKSGAEEVTGTFRSQPMGPMEMGDDGALRAALGSYVAEKPTDTLIHKQEDGSYTIRSGGTNIQLTREQMEAVLGAKTGMTLEEFEANQNRQWRIHTFAEAAELYANRMVSDPE